MYTMFFSMEIWYSIRSMSVLVFLEIYRSNFHVYFESRYFSLVGRRVILVTLMVALGFLPWNFGSWWGPRNGTLLQYECRLSGGDTMRWWGHSNPTLCNIICLKILTHPSFKASLYLALSQFRDKVRITCQWRKQLDYINCDASKNHNDSDSLCIQQKSIENKLSRKVFNWNISTTFYEVMLMTNLQRSSINFLFFVFN